MNTDEDTEQKQYKSFYFNADSKSQVLCKNLLQGDSNSEIQK